MPLDSNSPLTAYTAEKKDLYDLGEMPPLGHVPKQMYGWAIRKERHGEPDTAMLQEVSGCAGVGQLRCFGLGDGGRN